MTKLDELSDEDLDAWRANPMTKLLRGAITKSLLARRQAAMEAYWDGNPIDDGTLQGQKLTLMAFEDFFESTADDLRAAMEHIDEYERNKSD